MPSLDTPWQRTRDISWSGNAADMRLAADGDTGARVLVARFDAGAAQPTRRADQPRRDAEPRRSTGSARSTAGRRSRRTCAAGWSRASSSPPTASSARSRTQIVSGARTDREKVQRIYDWVIVSTYREPKVRGCGIGDIKTMLETGNLGGKCADINALFVGLCRAAGVPARDIYGMRLVPSAFGYKELGGNPASLKGAQHCRAEVYLKGHGWVAMDPADVTKVMRQETPEWIKDAGHPIVAPVRKALFGSWEGNWMGYNSASDVRLPGAKQRQARLLHVPAGGDRRRRARPATIPTVRVPDHGARDQGLSDTADERSPPRPNPQPARRTARRSALTLAGIAALLASACCVLPLVFVLVGVSGAWIGQLQRLEPYSPWLAGAGARRRWRSPAGGCSPAARAGRGACADDARGLPHASVPSRGAGSGSSPLLTAGAAGSCRCWRRCSIEDCST